MTTLSSDQAMTVVIEAIGQVAPDVAGEVPTLDRSIDVWQELQLDSMDHLNVMTELFQRTGVEIAERDYASLRSLGAIAAHLVARSAA